MALWSPAHWASQVWSTMRSPILRDITTTTESNKHGRHDLLCDSRIIAITDNSFEALLQLRATGQETSLWIDAVCIDQDSQ